MPSSSVRVEDETIVKLRAISNDEKRPIGQIVTDLVRKYEDEKFWSEMQEDYARLQADPVAWKDYRDEAAQWDTLSGDGLANEEPYDTAEEEERLRADDTVATAR
ncbi:MAG: hypothetical protein ACR2GI_01290 [Thermomicrobiales bacterium]